MACCYSQSVLMAMYPETEGCPCCHFKKRRDKLLRRRVPAEVVTTNTTPLPTDDVDELVSIIEGTSINKKNQQNKKSNENKLAKKARQKEKKRQEEEAIRRLEEERQRVIDAELEAARAEVARKKREKKKRSKQKKKGLIETNDDVGELDPEEEDNNEEEEEVLGKDMVTIRRVSAPETTVTISLRNSSGPEKVLFTLVNGQVVPGNEGEIIVRSDSANSNKYENSWFGGSSTSSGSGCGSGGMANCGGGNGFGVYDGANNQYSQKQNIPSSSTIQSKSHDSININNLKLPAGITITKIKKKNPTDSGFDGCDSEEGDDYSCNHSEIPKSGAGIYDIDSNRILMNPVSSADEESSNVNFQQVVGKKKMRKPAKVVSSEETTKKKDKKFRREKDGGGIVGVDSDKKSLKKKFKNEKPIKKTVVEPLRSPETFQLQHPPPSITPNDPVKMTDIVTGVRQRASSGGPTESPITIPRVDDENSSGCSYDLWSRDFMGSSRPVVGKSKEDESRKSMDSLNIWGESLFSGYTPRPNYTSSPATGTPTQFDHSYGQVQGGNQYGQNMGTIPMSASGHGHGHGQMYPHNYDPFKTERFGNGNGDQHQKGYDPFKAERLKDNGDNHIHHCYTPYKMDMNGHGHGDQPHHHHFDSFNKPRPNNEESNPHNQYYNPFKSERLNNGESNSHYFYNEYKTEGLENGDTNSESYYPDQYQQHQQSHHNNYSHPHHNIPHPQHPTGTYGPPFTMQRLDNGEPQLQLHHTQPHPHPHDYVISGLQQFPIGGSYHPYL